MMIREIDFLHDGTRKNEIHDVEDHLDEAVGLSRALWLLLANSDIDLDDCRDVRALKTLASAIADHASAAELAHSLLPVGSGKKAAAGPVDCE